jgi:hypothetical protein
VIFLIPSTFTTGPAKPFEIETDASDYAVGIVLTQNDHPVAYHSETLSNVVRKYPNYDKEMHSIVQACLQWRHYILGKEIVIHTDHKPLQFMHTQGRLHNDFHQKWSTYLQQFHLNIKYKAGSTNRIIDFLSIPPVATLTTVLDSCSHETYGWPQLYETDPDFTTTYQMLGANTVVANFHLQDGLLCRLGHICVPSSERVKMIHGNPTTVRWHDTSVSKRQWQCCRNISTSRNFEMRSESILGPALPAILPN